MTTYTYSPDTQALDALLEALDLPLDEQEWALALDALREIAASFEAEPPDLAEQLVGAVEKGVGLGLEDAPFAAAVAAVRRVLAPARPAPAPDAFLEAAFEDRFSEAT